MGYLKSNLFVAGSGGKLLIIIIIRRKTGRIKTRFDSAREISPASQ
jgi:hypothetical protein